MKLLKNKRHYLQESTINLTNTTAILQSLLHHANSQAKQQSHVFRSFQNAKPVYIYMFIYKSIKAIVPEDLHFS